MLHGAGGSGAGVRFAFAIAEELGVVVLAPDSRGRTWDAIHGKFGPDVTFISAALQHALARVAVDLRRLAVGGFSDGASYALSLGIANGDLFTHVLAFSPGFIVPTQRRGKPAVFISHGTQDDVLPVAQTSQVIVPDLQNRGYVFTVPGVRRSAYRASVNRPRGVPVAHALITSCGSFQSGTGSVCDGSGFRVLGSRLGSAFLVRSRFPGGSTVPGSLVPSSRFVAGSLGATATSRTRHLEPEPVNKEPGTNPEPGTQPGTQNPEPGTVLNRMSAASSLPATQRAWARARAGGHDRVRGEGPARRRYRRSIRAAFSP